MNQNRPPRQHSRRSTRPWTRRPTNLGVSRLERAIDQFRPR